MGLRLKINKPHEELKLKRREELNEIITHRILLNLLKVIVLALHWNLKPVFQ